MQTITINVGLVSLFEEKLRSFKKKFDKFGHATFICETSEPYFVIDAADRFYKQVVVDITIDASYKVADYEFVASLTWDEEANQNIIKKISEDIFVPHDFRTTTNCDHCGVIRYRKHTIILKNTKTGKYIQVGKSCCKDYLGQDISDYASYLSFFKGVEDYISDLETLGCTSRRKVMAFTAEEILLQTIESVKKHGYISKAISQENGGYSTSQKIFFAMNDTRDECGNLIYPKLPVTDESRQYLLEVLEYLDKADNTSDYVNNLKIVAQKGIYYQ